ncbi:NAD(+)--rifampin ADP-ribosyltransferase [Stigmatella hybrida]|uniref:NAD(+)--rifampin ADP-ribosyltransferase n=1 Tax=Stigmatella hybrida TaxID=394097 RepID=UPI001CDA8DF3|nr:NAD(+)--rifampin ADP-ribosyltransferase [Stigmatella hybrida]
MTAIRTWYHGTRAGLRTGDLPGPGHPSNYGDRQPGNLIYFSETADSSNCEVPESAG